MKSAMAKLPMNTSVVFLFVRLKVRLGGLLRAAAAPLPAVDTGTTDGALLVPFQTTTRTGKKFIV